MTVLPRSRERVPKMTAPTPRHSLRSLVAPLPKQRRAYALRLTDLPPDLERFMKETKSFFTRPHSLERHGPKLATSTFEKTEERVLCEYRSFYINYYSCIARYIFSH